MEQKKMNKCGDCGHRNEMHRDSMGTCYACRIGHKKCPNYAREPET